MKTELIAKGIYALATILLKMVSPDDLKNLADKGLDIIENRYGSVAPVAVACGLIRQGFEIPDND